MLAGSGFGPPVAAPTSPPAQVVVIVANGLYNDELFVDGATSSAAAPLRDLVSHGHALRRLLDAQPRLAGHLSISC